MACSRSTAAQSATKNVSPRAEGRPASERRTRSRTSLCLAAILATVSVASLVTPQAAHAEATPQRVQDFDLPEQALARSVSQIASSAGMQVLFDGVDATEAKVPALKGRMSAEQALQRVLAGSGYAYQYVRPGVITLIKASAEGNVDSQGERVTSVVRVEGIQGSPYFGGAGVAAGVNGINGSRDITATEGTGSFTSGALTIGSKVPQAMKDIPQSLSVLTNERMVQQNVTDFTTAMRQLPGVTLVQGTSSLESTFYSRGFEINSFQNDGGAPLNRGFGYFPQIDMSIYDHVELLRGAAGQFGAYGNPGGTVNLVRKKPLERSQFQFEAQAGSWRNYRVVADATSPLALNGALRGRVVMTYQDNHHFYDIAKDNKTLIYAIAELDVTTTTLLTAGLNYIRQDSVPWRSGLPRYLNGADLMLPRSTCLCFPWNRWDFDTTEIFGGLQQKVGRDWVLKVNLTHNRQASTQKWGYSSGAVNPDPDNLQGPQLEGQYQNYSNKQFSAEATLSGAFTLFGQRQEVTIGASQAKSDGTGYTDYTLLIQGSPTDPYRPYAGGPQFFFGSPFGARPAINVFDFDPNDPLFTEPRNPLPTTRYTNYGQTQTGAYINMRLTAFDRLHLTTGLRWSRFEYGYAYDRICTSIPATNPAFSPNCFGKQVGDVYSSQTIQVYRSDNFSWPPPVNVSFDVTKSLTAYVGYTDIYESQAYYLDANLNPLPPVTGANWEAGVKWAPFDGKLNLSAAAYRIRKKGFGMIDPPDYSGYYQVSPGVSCCYVVDPVGVYRSDGLDIEVNGEISRGWQVVASYNYNENEQTNGGSLYGNDGAPFRTISPKHLYKLWTSYDFGAAGHVGALSRLVISGGVNGQSSGYYSGSTCVRFDPNDEPDPITGDQDCLTDGYEDYEFRVPPHALLSARLDYRLLPNWSLAINLENLFDKTYYQTTSNSVYSGFWYGAPRSFTFSLRGKW